MANGLLDDEDTDPTHEGIEKIDRTTVPELAQLPAAYYEVQTILDRADAGLNPLGLARNVVPFGLNPDLLSGGVLHFDQIYDRATAAFLNAGTAFDFANANANRVRAMAEGLYARVEPTFRPSSVARPFAGLTIPELAREVLHRNGVSVQGLSGVSLIERALHTTSDFPLILADTVGRTLRASYDAATSAVRRLARETTAPDFRTRWRISSRPARGPIPITTRPAFSEPTKAT